MTTQCETCLKRVWQQVLGIQTNVMDRLNIVRSWINYNNCWVNYPGRIRHEKNDIWLASQYHNTIFNVMLLDDEQPAGLEDSRNVKQFNEEYIFCISLFHRYQQ